MSGVFVSYARADAALAKRVAAHLEKAGHEVWWDQQLTAHQAYSEIIEQKLRAAKAVVVLWSSDAAKSQWVRAEAEVARIAGTLVQARVDRTIPPLPFNQIQCADLAGWRGSPRHEGWLKLSDSVAALVSGEDSPQRQSVEARWWSQPRAWPFMAAAAVMLLLALFLAPRLFDRSDSARPVVAVLPFTSLAARDEGLVAGIWEDTRQALSRNPFLLVLGPNSSHELARKGASATRRAADYLIEASVRSSGDRIRVSANLVRSKDGVQLWSETFERRLDDVFELQATIAGEIEGRIRGRLARGGGTKVDMIATSGEVYALYSDARAKIRKRDFATYAETEKQLRRVVQMDPNFAPGWATLAIANKLNYVLEADGERSGDAEAFARRAIALAPRLAAGHAALGLALGTEGPVAQAELRRAVALDPNDIESLHWLANSLNRLEDRDEALRLYSRVVEIEPLWWPAIIARLNVLLERRDFAAAEQELARVKRLGADNLSTWVGIEIAYAKGDLSTAADLGLAYYDRSERTEREILGYRIFGILLQLGWEDEARRLFPPPPFGPFLWRNDPRGLDMVEKMNIPPRIFFSTFPLPMNAGRVYLLNGRGPKLAALIKSVASNPEDMQKVVGDPHGFALLAPFLALALRSVGEQEQARSFLAAAEVACKSAFLVNSPLKGALLARIYAVQGRDDEAIRQLAAAVNGGWLPDPPELQTDIAFDPALETLNVDPRFGRIREQILGHIRKERAELGPVRLDRSSLPAD